MSRSSRLKEYAKPNRRENWNGAARDQANIDRWSDRATDNSKIAPRASDGEMKLPSTKMNLRDTAMVPKVSRGTDPRMVAKSDKNSSGDSTYMAGIRRDA
jgi:hypothetical protein